MKKTKSGSWVTRAKPSLKYQGGYRYQLRESYRATTGCGGQACANDFIALGADGELRIRAGYAWDGPSGPAIDWPIAHVMPASLVHDALYQLIREKLLPADYRAAADRELYRQAIASGMWRWRAKLWLMGVSQFGKKHATKPKRVFTV